MPPDSLSSYERLRRTHASAAEAPINDGEPIWGNVPPAGHSSKHVAPYVPMKVLDPREWAGLPIPERQWIVPDWMPAEGTVTGNWGGGGDGKTILAMQLQVACSTGTRWIGLEVRNCPTFGIYCEDNEDELHRRFNDVSAAAGMGFVELGDMRCASLVGDDNSLVRFGYDGSVDITPRFDDMIAQALAINAEVLVVDTAADTFGNGNENDRGQVRAYISGVLRKAAMELGGAVLLNAHPSRSGISSGTLDGGSTGWSNTVRSRWALHRPEAEEGAEPDANARILTRMKSNYASVGQAISLRWDRGLLVPEKPPEGLSHLETLSRNQHAETVFLQLLDRLNSANIFLSQSKNAGNYAPKKMATQPDRAGFSSTDFARAMDRLILNGALTNQDHGRSGKERFHLVRSAPNDAGEEAEVEHPFL